MILILYKKETSRVLSGDKDPQYDFTLWDIQHHENAPRLMLSETWQMSKHNLTRQNTHQISDVTFKLILISLEFPSFRRETHWPNFKYYVIHTLRVFTINISSKICTL